MLRHAPWEYELEMDEQGWVLVEQLLDALNQGEKCSQITESDLVKMIEFSEKKRHEILDGKIRAFYGHSIPMKIVKENRKPPEVLYHGTANRFLQAIMNEGLLPQKRQYVHLSQDIETAVTVGRRHDKNAIVLEIAALKAWEAGIKFYFGNEKVWLADEIPKECILVKDITREIN